MWHIDYSAKKYCSHDSDCDNGLECGEDPGCLLFGSITCKHKVCFDANAFCYEDTDCDIRKGYGCLYNGKEGWFGVCIKYQQP